MTDEIDTGEGCGVLATRCPICGRPGREDFRPFCSQRCADVDLGRWLGERYVIPGPESGDERPGDEGFE